MKWTLSPLIFSVLMSFGMASGAQETLKDKVDAIHLTFFNNQTYIPFIGMGNTVHAKWHPGLATGVVFDGKAKERYTTFTTINAAVFHHRFIQTGIQLYGTRGIRYTLSDRFSLIGAAGAGYMHSIPLHKTYVADENGHYTVSGRLGRPQAMITLSGGIGYAFRIGDRSAQCQLSYQPWMHFPYIKSYVPLLPNNAVQLGIRYNLRSI